MNTGIKTNNISKQKKNVAFILMGIGLAATIYGWQMKRMETIHQETRMRTETRYEPVTTSSSTKTQRAGIGAAIGAIGAGVAATVIGGIGIVACGTGIGAPAGVGLIATAATIGGAGGAVVGAATGSSSINTNLVPYSVQVPETVSVSNPKYSTTQCAAVLWGGLGMLGIGAFLMWGNNQSQSATSPMTQNSLSPNIPSSSGKSVSCISRTHPGWKIKGQLPPVH